VAGSVRIGVSGWRYKSWRRDFYPDGLPQKRELEYLSRRLPSVEVNGSFYSLQRASSYRAWREQTPRGFRFALKGSRFITHNLKLGNARQALANFVASGILVLEEKLGPILWQLPSRQRFRADRLDEFLTLLPRDTDAARALALEHDERVEDPGTGAGPSRRLRYALEARNDSFFVEEAVAILRAHRVALVVSDAPGRPLVEELTAPFVYIRFHGHEELYRSRYSDDQLDAWADRIARWARGREPADARRIAGLAPPAARGRDVYAYFDNDARGHAPWDAERLIARVRARLGPASGEKEPPSRTPGGAPSAPRASRTFRGPRRPAGWRTSRGRDRASR
jgi:uncharacterized protein YecE (DUF72 family)